MQIVDVMTPNPRTVQPGDTLQAAAQLMDELNVGVLPVTDGTRLMGMLTDRDIVVRLTLGRSGPPHSDCGRCHVRRRADLAPDASVLDAIRMMQDQQLRRVPVVDARGTLVGILSLGDLADAGDARSRRCFGGDLNARRTRPVSHRRADRGRQVGPFDQRGGFAM